MAKKILEAFRHRLRCTLVVFGGIETHEPWYLLTDLRVGAVCGVWYGYRVWIEQGFRWLKRGGFGWHRCRVGSVWGVCWGWLVYALGCLLVMGEGLVAGGADGLWDRRRRSASVLLVGWMALSVKCWWNGVCVERERLGFRSGGKPK